MKMERVSSYDMTSTSPSGMPFEENMSNIGLTGRKNYYMELADIYNNIMFNIKPDNWRNVERTSISNLNKDQES